MTNTTTTADKGEQECREAFEFEISPGVVVTIDHEYAHLIGGFKWSFNGKSVFRRDYTNGANKRISLHRAIMRPPEGMVVDHIDGNVLNNTKENLRICTVQQNNCNLSAHRGRHTKFKGIFFNTRSNRWIAQISVHNKVKHIGSFMGEQEAAHAYNKAAIALHGDFARINPVGFGKV